MRNILKATTLENKFPLFTVENGCIVSKDADITAVSYTHLDVYKRQEYFLLYPFIEIVADRAHKHTLCEIGYFAGWYQAIHQMCIRDRYKTDEDEIWVDSYEVCTFLKISDRTLHRLRAAGMISYSDIKGHYFYKIKEGKRMLEERLIKRDKECINELITNHQKYVKERRNTKQDK